MFEILAVTIGSFTLALSGALMPGPLFTITVAESARRGLKAGPLLMVGHAALELLLIVGLTVGLGTYLKSNQVIGFVSLFGGIVLMWMGISMVRTAPDQSLTGDSKTVRRGWSPHLIVVGVLASLSNPYWTLWWATIGLGYLVAAMKFGIGGVLAFFLGHIAADFAWYSIISLGVSRGRSLLRDKSYQLIIRICGLLLLCFGGWFLYSAKTALLRHP